MTFYQDYSRPHDTSKNMAARGRGLFFVYICIGNFKIILVRNHWTDFYITWQECCFVDLLLRLFKQSLFVKKKGAARGGAYFSYKSKSKTLKIFLSETTEPISILLGRIVPMVTLYQVCSSCHYTVSLQSCLLR